MSMPDSVRGHWAQLIEGLQASPLELYAQMESAISSRQIPEIQTSRVEWKEAGLFSGTRQYLRVRRGKLVFDICAAPFGTGFFFSHWLIEEPPSAIAFAAFGCGGLIAITLVFGVAIAILKLFFGIVVGGIASAALAFFMGRAVASGAVGSVEAISSIPILGRVFDFLFRPETYYALDTAAMFQAVIHQAVLEVIDGATKAKGIRALSEAERKPVFRGLK